MLHVLADKTWQPLNARITVVIHLQMMTLAWISTQRLLLHNHKVMPDAVLYVFWVHVYDVSLDFFLLQHSSVH